MPAMAFLVMIIWGSSETATIISVPMSAATCEGLLQNSPAFVWRSHHVVLECMATRDNGQPK
jgi:hypothetical protein